MKRLKVNLFSGFSASVDGNPLTQFGTAKVQALFTYMLVESGHSHKREFLADLLWGEQEQEKALHSLRQAVSALRKVLNGDCDGKDWIVAEGDEIALSVPENLELDTAIFENACEMGLPDSVHRLRPEYLIQACELFRGPFLQQFSLREAQAFEEWAALKRELYNQQFVEMGELLCDYYEQRGNFHAARLLAKQMMAYFPWDEIVHLRLIKYLGLEGQYSAAEHQYQFCKRYLEKELAVQPSEEMEKLITSIRNRSIENKFKQYGLSRTAHFGSLPIFGREREITRVADLLSDFSTRLVTLHGPGGIGKTRLALELAHRMRGVFRDGVFFISLNSISDQSQIAGMLAQTFNLVISSRQDLASQVQDFLSQKEVLLFLDNSETVAGFAGWLDEWLQIIPKLVICHSSRERLNLQYENVIQLGGLAYPDDPSESQPGAFPAVDFFLDVLARAGIIRELPASEMTAVLDICRKVEGLPLAIEMAASQGWKMPLDEVNRALDNRIEVIETSYRNVPERHRTLIAVIDYSWSRLPVDQQQIVAALGVFSADFDYRAAWAICGADRRVLDELVMKSLVRINLAGRYELHAVIHRYAEFRLREDENLFAEIQPKYLTYFRNALFDLSITNLSANLFQKLLPIQEDLSNYLDVWRQSLAVADEDVLLKMASVLYLFYSSLSRFRECVHIFNEAREKISVARLPKLDIRLAAYCGAAGHIIDSRADLKKLLMDTRQRAHAAGMLKDEVFCLVHLVATLKNKDPRAEVVPLAKGAYELAQQIGDDWGIANTAFQCGNLDQKVGDCESALDYFNQTLQIANKHNTPTLQMMAANALGDVYCHIGDLALGRKMFSECLAISRKLGIHFQISIHLNNLGTIDQIEGKYDTAISNYEDSISECRLIGDQYGEAIALCNLGEVALLQHQVDLAEEYFLQAGEIGQRIADEYIRCICLTNLADIANRRGENQQAYRMLAEAAHLAESTGMFFRLMTALLKGAVIYHDQGEDMISHKFLSLVITHEATEADIRCTAREKMAQYFPGKPVDETVNVEWVMKTIDSGVN